MKNKPERKPEKQACVFSKEEANMMLAAVVKCISAITVLEAKVIDLQSNLDRLRQ